LKIVLFYDIFSFMTIEQIVEIPANHRLHLEFEIPQEIPAGKARAALTLICEEKQDSFNSGDWVNPLLGLAKKKGAKLTLEGFIEMQQSEIEREMEMDRRIWTNK